MASCVRMHGAVVIGIRVKQVASETSSASNASGRSGRNFFFPDVLNILLYPRPIILPGKEFEGFCSTWVSNRQWVVVIL